MAKTAVEKPEVQAMLNRLRKAARKDFFRFVNIGLGEARRILTLKKPRLFKPNEARSEAFKDVYIPISHTEGLLLYALARSSRARRILEFGTSFGISSIYLAAAIVDNGGGEFIGSELDLNKCEFANNMLAEIGFGKIAKVIQGDAMETFKNLTCGFDFFFLDGWKELYLDVLKVAESKINTGGIVAAADIDAFKKATRPFVEYVYESNSYEAVKLPVKSGIMFAIKKL